MNSVEEPVMIRRARQSDFDAVTALWQEMMDFHLSIDQRFDLAIDNRDSYKEYLTSIYENYDYAIFIAERDHKIIGYTIGMILNNPPVFSLKRYGFIAEMAVTADQQKGGVGREMWNHLRRWFHRRGITVMQLNVSPHNEKGYNFWKKMGCTEFLHIMWHNIPKNL